MPLSRLLLPYSYPTGEPVFITWRLCPRGTSGLVEGPPEAGGSTSGYLSEPAIADMVVDAIRYNARVLRHYVLHAFVIMPDHVQLLITPAIALPELTRALKGITARRAGTMLGLSDAEFWQEKSEHQPVRSVRELETIWNDIEESPVRAGLARQAGEYRWSSAAGDVKAPRKNGTTQGQGAPVAL